MARFVTIWWANSPDRPEPVDVPLPVRDVKREAKVRSLAARVISVQASLALSDGDAVGALLFGGLVEFRAKAGTVFTTPAFDRLIRDVKPRVTMGVSLSGNLINLVVDAGDLPASELSALLSSYRRRKRYHRLRSGAFIDLKEADLSQLDRLAGDLGLTARELASGKALFAGISRILFERRSEP